MSLLRWTVLVPLLIAGAACGADRPSSERPTAEPPTAQAAGDRAPGETLALPGAAVDRPAGWVFRAPTSSMRLAEADVPGPGGPALLTVFFFGAGGGGGAEANLERWAGQIEADPGAGQERATFEVDGYTVSTIAVSGTLLPSRMGGGPTEPTPGSRLLGAVVEGPGGPWFFKITGPAATVTAAAPAFDAMLRSVRP
ncbi:MAG: hypothetical protein MUC56_08740 [Thermoanaerobaculales bacterium]|jgi:hypothetical protein|nr:hypothetical protein [Thermoanaerobaculales bacterium]